MFNLETLIKKKFAEMDVKIKNLKSKKKKKADKKTFEQRMAVLSEDQKVTVIYAMKHTDPNNFTGEKVCCQGLPITETFSFWPPRWKDEKTKE